MKGQTEISVCAKFHHYYWIFALMMMRNLMAIQRGKSSEKQEGGKQLGKLENELMCDKKKNKPL